MALSSENCGRTFSNAEVATEGLTAGSLYSIRPGCPNSNIFELCDGALAGGNRSYETLRHGRSSKAKIYDGDQNFDQLSDMEFVFGGQSMEVGSILSHLNHTETFPTGCAAHSRENMGKVFPKNLIESGDVKLGHVYDKSCGQSAFSVGGICDDMAAPQIVPGFSLGTWESKVGSKQWDATSSQVNFPLKTSDLPSSNCRTCEPEEKKSETDDFDWSSFNMIDPLHRFSQISGLKSSRTEGKWLHSMPDFVSTQITEPFVTSESAHLPFKDSVVKDSLHLVSQNEHDKPQISTTVPHNIFAREVPSSGSANEFSAEPNLVFRPRPPATCKLANDSDSREPGDCSAGKTFEALRPVNPTSASISVESFNGGSKCTSTVQTTVSEESKVKEDKRKTSVTSSSKSQPSLGRKKTEEAKPFFDPRRIFASASKPEQQKTAKQRQSIRNGRTSDCSRDAVKEKETGETTSDKAPDFAKSKEMPKRMDEKISSKSSDSKTEAWKKSEEKTSNPSSKNWVLNNNKSHGQGHSSHTLDRSHFIKNDLSDFCKHKNADVRADSGRDVHDRSSEPEQEPGCLREMRAAERVGDEQPALRKVKNTTEIIGEKQDMRTDSNSTNGSSYLLKLMKEKIFSFAVWAFYEILPIILNMLKLVIGIIFYEVFSISYHICRFAGQGLMWFCQWAKQRAFPSQDESAQEGPKPNWWHNHVNHKARASNHFLSENITLPESGDEAIRRLFSCEGKDPYSILGLKVDCTDEEIRKYFRRQAVLVHPDKNNEPGAEEAFKILNHAFELIGEPEKRRVYNAQTALEHDEDIAMHQFNDLLTKLHEAMQESMKYMGCSCCGGKHKRVPVDRPVRGARYCAQCDLRHSAKEGDVWAESSRLGFLWRYFACMEGQIYDVTEWASCQQDDLRHIPANSHQVLIHISTGRSRQQRSAARDAETELKDLLESMYGTPTGASDTSGQYGRGATNDAASNGWRQGQGSASKRRRRRRR